MTNFYFIVMAQVKYISTLKNCSSQIKIHQRQICDCDISLCFSNHVSVQFRPPYGGRQAINAAGHPLKGAALAERYVAVSSVLRVASFLCCKPVSNFLQPIPTRCYLVWWVGVSFVVMVSKLLGYNPNLNPTLTLIITLNLP